MARILIIEDEADIQKLLRFNLHKDGHAVITASTGSEGLAELRRQHFDLVLLDLMLPDRDGLDVCRTMRADAKLATIPIIMVTAKGEESDVVLGLGIGADDYVAKPFRIKELMARIKVRLVRNREVAVDGDRRAIQAGSLMVDPVRHKATVAGNDVHLTLTEFKLLHHLVAHRGVAFSRYDLIDRLGDGDGAVTDRTIDVHIRNLRAKIKPCDQLIETVRGVGYRFWEGP
jgi:two-component system phosphate regulon response regulator PhoB